MKLSLIFLTPHTRESFDELRWILWHTSRMEDGFNFEWNLCKFFSPTVRKITQKRSSRKFHHTNTRQNKYIFAWEKRMDIKIGYFSLSNQSNLSSCHFLMFAHSENPFFQGDNVMCANVVLTKKRFPSPWWWNSNKIPSTTILLPKIFYLFLWKTCLNKWLRVF